MFFASRGGRMIKKIVLTITAVCLLFITTSVATGTVNISGMSISPSGVVNTGDVITLAVNASDSQGAPLYYKFFYCAGYGTAEYATNPWIVMQEYSTSNTCTYSFSDADDYIIVVRVVTDPENEPAVLPIYGKVLTVGSGSHINFSRLSIDRTGPLTVADTVTFTVDASCSDGSTVYYKFYACPNYGTSEYETSTWSVLQDYSTANTCSHTFAEANDYIVVARAVTDPENEPEVLPIYGGLVHIGNQGGTGTVSGTWISTAPVTAVAGSNGYIYALTDNTMVVLDISTPSAPVEIADIAVTDETSLIEVVENYIVTASHKGSNDTSFLTFYDNSEPDNISVAATYPLYETITYDRCVEYFGTICLRYEEATRNNAVEAVQDIAVSNNTVFLIQLEDADAGWASCQASLSILDFSDIANISQLYFDDFYFTYSYFDLTVRDNSLYITENNHIDCALVSYDISDLENIEYVHSFTGDLIDDTSVAVTATHAFVAGAGQFYIYKTTDVTDYSYYNATFSFEAESDVEREIVVVGNYAYITGSDGLIVLDITDPENPEPVEASLGINERLYDIHVVDSYLVCAGESGIYLINPF